VTLRELQAQKAAPAVAEDEYLVLAELPADPGGHFLGVGDHALAGEGRRDRGRIGKEMGLAGGALVPLDDREILLPAAGEPPAHRDRDVPWSAVDQQQHRVPAVGAANRDPLIDPADPHFLQPLHPIGRHDLARICDDRGRLNAAGGFGSLLRPNGGEYGEKGEQVRDQPPEGLDRIRVITLVGS